MIERGCRLEMLFPVGGDVRVQCWRPRTDTFLGISYLFTKGVSELPFQAKHTHLHPREKRIPLVGHLLDAYNEKH